MKKVLLFLTLVFININYVISQSSISETKKLTSFCKVYGFLKYYHPEVAKGKFNWDDEFIKRLPQIKTLNNKQEVSEYYLNWIEGLGKIKKCNRCKNKEVYFDKNFDLSWIQDSSLFSDELISKLKYIENNRNQRKNFYATNERVGKIKITNEPTYENFDYPNEDYRLLGLFKYWNIIEYFYPYKYLTDQDWDDVLLEMIPEFRSASDKNEYRLAIKKLVAKLNDSHAWISFEKNKYKYLPASITNIDDKAVIASIYNDSIASLNNLKLGDIILKINNINLESESQIITKHISSSNAGKKRSYSRLLAGQDSIVTLTIKRGNELKELKVKRYDFKDIDYRKNPETVKTKSINDNIGYINLPYIKGKDIADIFESFKDKKSIIIDIRGYPPFIYKWFTRFLNSEKKPFAKVYSPNINYPGKFTFKENLTTNKGDEAFKGKIFILVNENSMSRAEFTAMAFQTADNAITIGNQTAGADGDVAGFEYMGGYRTAISGNGILYPDETETQRKGIKIDVVVEPTIQGLIQGRDEILEKAIKMATE